MDWDRTPRVGLGGGGPLREGGKRARLDQNVVGRESGEGSGRGGGREGTEVEYPILSSLTKG